MRDTLSLVFSLWLSLSLSLSYLRFPFFLLFLFLSERGTKGRINSSKNGARSSFSLKRYEAVEGWELTETEQEGTCFFYSVKVPNKS